MSHVVRYAPRVKPEVVLEVDESRDPFELLAAVERNLGLSKKPDEDWARMLEARRAREAEAAAEESERRAEREPKARRREEADRHQGEILGATGKAGSNPARSQRSCETGGGFDSRVRDSGEPKARPATVDTPTAESVGESTISGVRGTSIAAYRKARVSGKLTAQQTVIADWLRGHIGDATRQEIARGTGVAINAVCGRVKEMLDAGVLRETRQRRCLETGETANAVRLA